MPTRLCPTFAPLLLIGVAAVVAPDGAAAVQAPTSRTVYVTVSDNKGAPITDLTAADFVVKEGGKEREIVKAEPASTRMQLTVAVEEILIGDASTRMGIFEFLKRIVADADVRLITIGIRNHTVADYTSDMNTLVGAINKFTLNPNRASNVAEGILEIATQWTEQRTERPVLVVVAVSGGQAGVDPRSVLEKLRQSGAQMHAATLTAGAEASGPLGAMGDQSGREQILGDGPKQSGGRRQELTTPTAFPKALQQIASELQSQYAITYTLPDGVKPDKRLNVSVKRRGASLRAPSQIPDR